MKSLLLAASLSFLVSIAHGAVFSPVSEDVPRVLADKEQPADLKKFLHSTKGTYGWAPVKGEISYDFFKDGRVHIQGKDGEATMWEGTWTLKGDKLTVVNKTQKKTTTFTVTVEGDTLLLDGNPYKRVKAE